MSDWIFDHHGGFGRGEMGGRTYPDLGPEYLLTDEGQLVTAASAQTSASHATATTTTLTTTGSPAATLVGSPSGLEFDLVWDASVRGASNWQSVEHAVIQAAKVFTSSFTTHLVINIHVGLGEIDGSSLMSGALGESESSGYLVNYATVTRALASADSSLVSSGQMSAGAASDLALSAKTFFVAGAEAKALGLVSATGTGVDGYIGLTNSSALFYAASGGQIGSHQYDAVGVAAHEISEVMGRIGMEGSASGHYTPLDLFRYAAAHHPDLTPTAGYFSTNFGVSVLNSYNSPSNGGDAADWATSTANARDAFDAFANPGVITNVSKTDLLEVASLGYRPSGPFAPITA